jgi:hypothetical protein
MFKFTSTNQKEKDSKNPRTSRTSTRDLKKAEQANA